MRLIVLTLLALLLLSACSSPVEYQHDPVLPSSPTAVNINTATATELERLPYIGRTTAESIVEFRQEHGPFRRPEQLMLIRGVSETRFAEIRHLLTTR
jgi:competence ComEA-like helix-hairpin-helix protein